jgi:hypothetical protein
LPIAFKILFVRIFIQTFLFVILEGGREGGGVGGFFAIYEPFLPKKYLGDPKWKT